MNFYSFGDFKVSTEDRRLFRSSGEEVPLTPRVFELLLLLIENRGRVLSKNEILDAIWPDSIVEESNLSQNIFVLRKALGESPHDPHFIRTVPTKGYRFIGDVQVSDPSAPDPPMTVSPADDEEKVFASRHGADTVGSLSSRRGLLALMVVGFLVLATAAFMSGRLLAGRSSKAAEVSYQQLTFERGTVWSGRFLPASNAVIYNANFNHRGLELYTFHLQTPEARPMGLPNTNLLSISSRGEMALLREPTYIYQFVQRGTLARMFVDGSAPRDVAENVQEADWDPAGEQLAIVRWTESGNLLEYPIGTAIAATPGYFSYPRIAPTGGQVAFFRHPFQKDNRGSVVIADLSGKEIVATEEFAGLEGLAWNKDEVWFTASKNGETYALYSVSSDGIVRNVIRSPSNLLLNDIAADGSVLLSRALQQTDVYLNTPGHADADLSWLQLIGVADLASDGSSFLFTHFGEGSGKNYSVYLRKTDGSPAVKLGEGRALALCPGGRWAVAKISDPESLVLLPTGAGQTRSIPIGDLEHISAAAFSADGKKLIFTANEKDRGRRSFILDVDADATPAPLTPEGVYGTLLSPDGTRLIVKNAEGTRSWFSLKDGQMSGIPGIDRSEEILRWTTDSNTVYTYRPMDLPIKMNKLDLRTGRREFVGEIQPTNASGAFGNTYLFTTADAKTTVYGIRRYLIDLYLAKGLQ